MSSSNELKECKEPGSPSPPLTGLRRSTRKVQLKQRPETRTMVENKGNEHPHQEASIMPEKTRRSQRLLPKMHHPIQNGSLNSAHLLKKHAPKRASDPSMPLEYQLFTAEQASVVPIHHQSVEYNAPVQAEGPDPTSRPRLTTEQTNTLESKFQQNPKPTTDTKKELAQEIGLTPDKVNVS